MTVGLEDEGEIAADAMDSRFFLGKDVADAVDTGVAQLAQLLVQLGVFFSSEVIRSVDQSGSAAGLDEGAPGHEVALFIDLQPAILSQHGVDGNVLGDIDLAMVGNDEPVGILKDTGILKSPIIEVY